MILDCDCKTCFYWVETGMYDMGEIKDEACGECHRFPPYKTLGLNDDERYIMTIENDSCGEWKHETPTGTR